MRRKHNFLGLQCVSEKKKTHWSLFAYNFIDH